MAAPVRRSRTQVERDARCGGESHIYHVRKVVYHYCRFFCAQYARPWHCSWPVAPAKKEEGGISEFP